MALGCDPRFDLREAYWLVAGIAGVDPADASLGSAAWAEWVVDGDLAHEIDPREMPKEWTTGFFPLDESDPYPNNASRQRRCHGGLPSQRRADGMGLPTHQGRAAARQRTHEDQSRALHRQSQRAEAALRAQGRQPRVRARSGTASCSTAGPTTGSNTGRRARATTSRRPWRTAGLCNR